MPIETSLLETNGPRVNMRSHILLSCMQCMYDADVHFFNLRDSRASAFDVHADAVDRIRKYGKSAIVPRTRHVGHDVEVVAACDSRR